MNHKFLVKRSLVKLFEESEMSVGEIMRTITQEKFTGIKIENKRRLTELSDQDWYEVVEKACENENETEFFNGK